MENIFHDISKYYAANIVGNVLIIGKIIYQDGMYRFARDDVQGPFNLVDPEADVTRMVHVIGEIHPRQAVERIFPVEVNSCLFHKGMGTAIYSKQECPLILWNPKYEEHQYFDVIDIQGVFKESRLKDSFSAVLAESLREFELFPPLIHMKK
ncbi:MAG: hypothetical protein GWP56_10835 [Gammaproteobacteria bacterium]|nr:hypothetical protein [Gammaproteobacteria bacterium]